jgi:hypothetical protein
MATNLFFIRSCPIWNIQIPAQSTQEMPEWIAKRLITGGVAMLEEDHRARMAERSKRKAEEKAKAEPKVESIEKPMKIKKGGKE